MIGSIFLCTNYAYCILYFAVHIILCECIFKFDNLFNEYTIQLNGMNVDMYSYLISWLIGFSNEPSIVQIVWYRKY